MELTIDATQPDLTFVGLLEALHDFGWWLKPGFLIESLVNQLRQELIELDRANRLRRAGVGRGLEFQKDESVRGDKTFWLNRSTLAQCLFLDEMEKLRVQLNRQLFMGLFEFESHFALYEPGAFYQKHLDSFKGAANRVVSVVAYLNDDWLPEDGGQLVIYDAVDQEVAVQEILPLAGTVVVFLSEEIPHEVLIANRHRYSIAGWFRVNGSMDGFVDPPR